MTRSQRELQHALDLWRQVTEAKLSRREVTKLGLLAGGAGLLKARPAWARRGRDDDDDDDHDFEDLVSPPTTPWVEEMPVPPVKRPRSPFASSRDHQYYNLFPPQKFYEFSAEERPHSFHPDLPTSPIWGLDGAFPGPTIDARYGEPYQLRVRNRLPSLLTHKGFGIPQTVHHLHNAHTATESDGGPWDWVDPEIDVGSRKSFRDMHYLMQRAGFSVPDTIPSEFRDAYGGDVRETLSTLFMHYHRPEFTADGVYKGLVNFVRFFDELDTGDETTGWRLPSGDFDVPILITDKQFDPFTGELIFDQFNLDGFLGDKTTANGKIQPFFEVKRRKYRFRLLNGSLARFYKFVLRHDGRNQPFDQITDNGNFLERPRRGIKRLETQVAERSDIIIDFSRFRAGDRVYLCNILPMKDGRRPERDRDKALDPDQVKNQLIEFRVGGDAADPSQVPDRFREFPPINMDEVVRTRHWRFERENGMWAINGELWDPLIDHTHANLTNPPHQIRRNTAERWVLQNNSGGWEHPIHIHLEEAQILKINGRRPRRKARLDMYRVGRNTTIELFIRFRDFPDPNYGSNLPVGEIGRYVMHCHNITHEDHAMMLTWNIVPD